MNIVQIAFDWTEEHLHRFHIHGKDYGIAYRGGLTFDDNPRDVLLSHFRLHSREAFRYEYDFTAKWRVDINPPVANYEEAIRPSQSPKFAVY